jgi:hypothetical protein
MKPFQPEFTDKLKMVQCKFVIFFGLKCHKIHDCRINLHVLFLVEFCPLIGGKNLDENYISFWLKRIFVPSIPEIKKCSKIISTLIIT